MRTVLVRVTGALLVLVLAGATGAVGACGGSPTDSSAGGGPRIVVTTSILGDVVTNLVGDSARVEVLMPPGSSPHDFAPSPQQVAALRSADVVIVNGLGFEAGLLDTIEAAADDGTVVVQATDGIEPLTLAGSGAVDPHFFTDPVRMREAASYLVAELTARLPALDTDAQRSRAAGYLDELTALDEEVTKVLAPIPAERRRLVTNHEVFGYFAARYGFEVIGAVIPGGSTLAEPSAADLARLAAQIERAGVPAIFAETSSSTRLAEALAGEGRAVAVVSLYSESLGEAGSDGATYLGMVRANAARIAGALG